MVHLELLLRQREVSDERGGASGLELARCHSLVVERLRIEVYERVLLLLNSGPVRSSLLCQVVLSDGSLGLADTDH